MNDLTNCETEMLGDDDEFVVSRARTSDGPATWLLVAPTREQPAPASLAKLEHALILREELNAAWAARPVELVKFGGQPALVIEDPDGEFLDRLIYGPMAAPDFLRLAIGIANSLAGLHARGLVHKDVKPANLIVKVETGQVWFTGFGIASRLPRERQAAEIPEIIAGTLAYMAPEQTGRMNRSVDSRSDLYSLGVTFYEMLVGLLPFTANDPMEWVHCHIARQPVAPCLRRNEIPEPLSAIILKLLAKASEERYQTATGLEADLRSCLSALEAHGQIAKFCLGARDVPARLLVPEKLYGREKEIEMLLAAFHRVVSQGTTELVLVSGYSGVGKSSVVNELHKALAPSRALFASGKFDQYKRDIPYATLAQAFGTLVRQILCQSHEEVAHWRQSLTDALGPNGQLVVNLVPEIELIIGKPPPVPDLPPQETRNRFERVLRRFIGVFARPEHPLALFLDDLQWLDTATLELIERLIADPELRHVLLVGAYRDNEVDAGHPLRQTLQKIRAAGPRVHDIVLSPLGLNDLTELAADALHCPADHSRPLAQLVHAKTSGNPFFAIQFITALVEENLIAFDPSAAAWKWDLARILTKGYTDNVVELMIAKLNRLPEATQNSLKQLACVGNSAGTATLNLIYGETEEELHTALWEAVRLGLVLRSDNTYSFAHDRIQQAAYSLIPDEHRGGVHLRIGRALLSSMTEGQLADHLFDVANQLNRGAASLADHDEKVKVAEINLRAGCKAKASAAYATADTYFASGMALLDESGWSSNYELIFRLWLERAECEFLTGRFDDAEQLIVELLPRAASKVDQASVYCLKILLLTMTSENQRAVDAALTCLRGFGIDMPAHPTEAEVQVEYETFWQALNGRSIESLIDLPLMTNPEMQAATQVLSVLSAPAYFTDPRLQCLQTCRMVGISVQHGISRDSGYAYANWGFVLSGRLHRYREGYRFTRLACDLVEKHGFILGKAKVYVATGATAAWTQPIAEAIDFVQKGFRAAIEAGDLTYACLCAFISIMHLLRRDDPLDVMWRESEMALNFVRNAKSGDATDIIVSQQRFIASMQGRTATLSTFSDAQFDEAAFEARITAGRMPMVIGLYWILKLKARFLSCDYAAALSAGKRAKELLGALVGRLVLLDYFYYAALTVSALYESATVDDQKVWRELLEAHREQLREWTENNPSTFADKLALVSAEIAHLERRDADAMRFYEQAIRAAREQGFVQNEGLAYEVAARFYVARGFETFADAYLRKARYCYLQWGADGKVRQFDRLYPHLAAPEGPSPASLNVTIGAPVVQLDAETVARASQALSSEIVLPRLIERLMRIAVEHAGAERGLLILLHGSDPFIEAEAATGHGRVDVHVRQADITSTDLPKTALQYVIRTRKRVILDDASVRNPYSDDEYLAQGRAKSLLCLPIIKQTKLIGVLYLENNLTPHVFTSDRVAVLEMLASQAAISLENARLYAALEQENLERKRAEEELRRSEAYLAEAQKLSCTGSFGWNASTDEHVWSDETFRIFEYDLSAKVTLQMILDRVLPQDLQSVRQAIVSAAEGRDWDFEYRLLMPGGSVKHVRVVAHVISSNSGDREYVGAVTDVTATRRAEEAVRRGQAELAHVNRVATLGELTASIAHEVNQPLTAIVNNANACLDLVPDSDPRVQDVREALAEIVDDADRASGVIARVRQLVRKAPFASALLNLTDIVTDVLALAQYESAGRHVTIRIDLMDDIPPVMGDRVQLQQVLLNLIVNGMDAMKTTEEPNRILTICGRREMRDGKAEALLGVQDAGSGLKLDEMDRLFEAFFTTKPQGMGMGLAISRSIIEAHGGRLWAEPNQEIGATFLFSLPAAGNTLS